MRAAILLLAMTVVACAASTTEPDDGACEGYGCDAFAGDTVGDTLLTYPDSLDPTTGMPWDTMP